MTEKDGEIIVTESRDITQVEEDDGTTPVEQAYEKEIEITEEEVDGKYTAVKVETITDEKGETTK